MLYAFNLRAFFGEILRCVFGARHRTKARVRVRVTGRGRVRVRIEKTRPRGVFHKKSSECMHFLWLRFTKICSVPKTVSQKCATGD